MTYTTLLELGTQSFDSQEVLVVGAGLMSQQYCKALTRLGIRSVTVVSRSREAARHCCEGFGFRPYHGGYEKNLPLLGTFDLVIIATPVHELQAAAEFAASCGNRNILVEKPGSIYSRRLREWAGKTALNVRVRVAFNRLVYPNFWRLKELVAAEGGLTSCHYTFTELVDRINFGNNRAETYARWGIANSLHVISMAHDLVGIPAELSSFQAGQLDWHPSGSQFTGAGLTTGGVPFSYHADWSSGGRWGIEVMTTANAYRMIPLEQLWRNERGSFDWSIVPTTSAFPDVKQGIAEEIAIMLQPGLEAAIPLVTLAKAAEYAELAERIFGYGDSQHA